MTDNNLIGMAPRHKSTISIRALKMSDQAPLEALIRKDGLFTEEEVGVALELIEAAHADETSGYYVYVATSDECVVGYICYGPTPMTEATWDLYWVVTHPEFRGCGIARRLVEHMEQAVQALGAHHIRVETSQSEGYGSAHLFYARMHYPVVSRLADFYKSGDDLLVMYKKLL